MKILTEVLKVLRSVKKWSAEAEVVNLVNCQKFNASNISNVKTTRVYLSDYLMMKIIVGCKNTAIMN